MCGIFGYVGKKNALEIALKGLKLLEYRGYDSAGVAGISLDGELIVCKEVGKVAALESQLLARELYLETVIAHTRWATHGKPSQMNAHPHNSQLPAIALVHNGIIENYQDLRRQLEQKGVTFLSQTDTEVIVQLIAHEYHGNILEAVQRALPQLIGSFAIALIHKDQPKQIIAVAQESPLVIGIGDGETLLSSDAQALALHTRDAIYLSHSEIAVIEAECVKIYSANLEPLKKPLETLAECSGDFTKGHYPHYTLKEIHEQPQTIRNALLGRYNSEYGNAIFDELKWETRELQQVERILILACGTSWHAGFVAAYMIEEMAQIPVQVEISSEFRYKNPIVLPETLVIAISQSGETADTLAAVREVKAKGARVLGICNVHGSMLAREADTTIYLRAGPEIGVCSTKAFTSQLTVLSLLSLLFARLRHMDREQGMAFVEELRQLPEKVQRVLGLSDQIEQIAKRYANYSHFFFLGRLFMYPAALEGALKLKEISYINANGYPAGEMKHGPIALIDEQCPIMALCANEKSREKIISNLMEVKARSGKIIAVVEEGDEPDFDFADELIVTPRSCDQLAAIPTSVACQLFAYFVAKERGEPIDKPRNLAKSVTVE